MAASLFLGCSDAKPEPVPAASSGPSAPRTMTVTAHSAMLDEGELNAPAVPQASDLVAAAYEGDWEAISATMAGNPLAEAATKSITLNLTGDQYAVMVGDMPDKGSFIVDLSQSPARMTITGSEGPNAGKSFLAVYDFPNEGEMRVSYDLTGKEFPASFESTPENGLYVVTYKRKE